MSRETFEAILQSVLKKPVAVSDGNFASLGGESEHDNQNQTNDAFSKKWGDYKDSAEKARLIDVQKAWYLECYGFADEGELAAFLKDKAVIFDAGCGIGFKAAWFAQLAPHALVVGMDFSQAARFASEAYRDIPNLFFIQNDIARPFFKGAVVDYVSCDQVIMHTEDPEKTFTELSRITKGEFACYFYAKKALPRELMDDYFRIQCAHMTHDELMEMSDQLSELGKRLSELKISFDVPEIPALGIKGGPMDVQRFLYWNFLKCYWNPDLGRETSTMINFDWYSPSNARRYSRAEVEAIVANNNMHIKTFHEEEACYTGRFVKAA